MSRWWDEPFRTFQTNLREIDAGLDVQEVADYIADYGADTWLLSTAGIITNYPSDLDCQTVNPALSQRASGDLIGDALQAASARGIRILGRLDFSKIDARRAEEHPEWCYLSPDGEPQIYNGYRSTCPSAGYYQEKTFEVITEILGRYELSGFFYNMMHFNEADYSRRYWGVCHCEACLRGFREYAPGVEHPRGPKSPGYRIWREFSTGVLDDLQGRLREHMRSLNPDVAFIQGDRGDITFLEANNAVGRPLWHHRTAEQVSAARSGDPDRPVFVNSVSFVDMPYRWAGEDPQHFAQYLLQTIAHGGQPSTYVMGTHRDSPHENLQVGSRITRFHRDNAAVYQGLHSIADVALVRGRAGFAGADDRRQSEFRGLYLSLTEQHVPFDVVRQDRLADLDPQRYRLVILADVGPLTEAQIAAVDGALRGGAHVVATGESGWQDGVLQLGVGELARQVAVLGTEESVRSLHLPMADGGRHIPVVGGFQVLQPSSDAQADWPALGRSLYGPPEKCYGNEPTSHPGWVAGNVGAGRLAVMPWRPGLVYHEVGLRAVRDALVHRIVEFAGGRRQVSTTLPDQLQVVLGRSAGATVVHLLNRSGDAAQRFMEPVPIGAGSLRIRGIERPGTVRALVEGRELGWSERDGSIEIDTPQVGRFEVIEISPE